jgi:hypothetical protein
MALLKLPGASRPVRVPKSFVRQLSHFRWSQLRQTHNERLIAWGWIELALWSGCGHA